MMTKILYAFVWVAVAVAASPQAFARDMPQPVVAQHGMVVTAQHLATQVGVDILKQGGNAIDAAVAVGYALAVVHPCCGNIGGGGFMLIRLANGKTAFLNFREKAPLAASASMYQNRKGHVVNGLSTKSWLSIGVPGTVMGLNTALKKYGTLSLKQVMAPAIKLAAEGFVLVPGDVAILHTRTDTFAAQPNVANIFLNHGKPYQVGDRLVQKRLAHTLRLIAQHGTKAFYDGPIAAKLARASQAHDGLLTKKDFENYTVEWEKPIHCEYRGYDVWSSPPPSSGGTTMCEIMNIVSGYPLPKFGFHSVDSVHYLAEAMRYSYADRNTKLGDPDFVHNPIDKLLSAEHAKAIRTEIDPQKPTPSSKLDGGMTLPEGDDTTHYSVVDKAGNAVAVTYTINWYFGSGHIAGDTGFFLNNEMDDFTSKPGVPNSFGLVQGEADAIAPGKRPLSSMTPTIVTRDGKLFMVTGSPGGSRIITITLESILNVIDYGMNVQQAINAPRIHQQWLPDMVLLEPHALKPDVRATLEKRGYAFRDHSPWGAAEAIVVDPKTGLLNGASDPREPAGAAAGY
ncbi:MAG TPA: gamma-glutamyltransferase [Gammaproteobacteria bacterium]|nr:gamma-glutamyltransferase [Gammaproteobacteria bacterium]